MDSNMNIHNKSMRNRFSINELSFIIVVDF